jgi:squalene-hopene/tetraprenyl-beta-curcumene cyclase
VFGSQLTPDHSNPVYGTARVLTYLADANSCRWIELEHALHEKIARMNKRAAAFLVSAQNQDGSWGGDKNMAGTIEETALAVSALLAFGLNANLESGVNWLADKIKSDGFEAAPIGLYFASLWYSERLYPLTATMECLSRLKERQWD